MDIVPKNPFLLPTLKLDDQKYEFIFLMDVSGSMNGTPLELAKQALKLFLHSLPSTCYFNVVFFSTSHRFMFPRSVKYDQATLETAKSIVSAVRSEDSTNIYTPLDSIYRSNQIPGYLTQIFAITDGHVERRDQVLDLVKAKVKHSRAYALGIGSGADPVLVKGIAEGGGGFAEFVQEGEKIESKILHQLKMSLKPALLKPIRVSA